jgi:hypothetical protein
MYLFSKNVIPILFLLFISLTAADKLAYLSPLPFSKYHPVQTRLIIRFHRTSPEELENLDSFIEVEGESSGPVTGRTILSSDGRTIIFKPDGFFSRGEKVWVHLVPVLPGEQKAFLDTLYYFDVSGDDGSSILQKSEMSDPPTDQPAMPQNPGDLIPIIQNGVVIPADFPRINITVNDNPDTGLIFINNWGGVYYMMILDNQGDPVWYQKVPDRRRDFKLQKNGRLTMFVSQGYGGGNHIALDSTYAVVDTFFHPAGYTIDQHELQVLPDGHYFIIVADRQTVDMSQLVEGGNPRASVLGNHVAEMDADDNCIFLWRSWDHFNITDAIHENLTASSIEYVHMNAIEIDHDGQILISSRFQDEISKIDRETGDFIWRLGGVNNQFEWLNDEYRLAYQHDIRVLPNGHYTVFDNGNRRSPVFSRALELAVDTLNMTVEKVWEYRENPDIYAKYMGNTQRLPNGNTLINWAIGTAPKLTEVRPDGSKAYELNFANNYECYRVFRFPWKGKAAVPYLLTESASDHLTLIFNKFGDRDVTGFNIYAGPDPDPDQIIATAEEPYIQLFNLPGGAYYYFRVTALDSAGEESGFSNEVKTYITGVSSGENLLVNGDFSQGFDFWSWDTDTADADAMWEIDSTGMLHIAISDGGTKLGAVRISYPNLRVAEGNLYVLEFDAHASANRIFQAEVSMRDEPFQSYSKIGYILLTDQQQHFSYQFAMENPTDFTAGIVLSAGNSNDDVYIDNVSLKELPTGIDGSGTTQPEDFVLRPNFPNPFNPQTTIAFAVPEPARITLVIYNVLGEKLKILADNTYRPGNYQIRFDASGLSSGLYLCRMQAEAVDGGVRFTAARKILLLR